MKSLLLHWRPWAVALLAPIFVVTLYVAFDPLEPRRYEAPPLAETTPDAMPPAATPSPERPSQTEALQASLEAIVRDYPARTGILIRHLESGDTVSVNAHEQFRSASLYKLFVLFVAYKDIEEGALQREEMLTLSFEAFSGEAFPDWQAGTQASVAEALDVMIRQSGNSAAAMLVERLGGEERINAEMRDLGLEQSELTDQAYTSPADIARLLELIATGEAVSEAASREMLAILHGQQREDLLPYPLPHGVEVAHKTGELQNLRNDAGIVFAPSGPYIFVALVMDAPSDADARAAVVELSRISYEHFEGAQPTLPEGAEPLEDQDQP